MTLSIETFRFIFYVQHIAKGRNDFNINKINRLHVIFYRLKFHLTFVLLLTRKKKSCRNVFKCNRYMLRMQHHFTIIILILSDLLEAELTIYMGFIYPEQNGTGIKYTRHQIIK